MTIERSFASLKVKFKKEWPELALSTSSNIHPQLSPCTIDGYLLQTSFWELFETLKKYRSNKIHELHTMTIGIYCCHMMIFVFNTT